jgi:hypothetical protein
MKTMSQLHSAIKTLAHKFELAKDDSKEWEKCVVELRTLQLNARVVSNDITDKIFIIWHSSMCAQETLVILAMDMLEEHVRALI